MYDREHRVQPADCLAAHANATLPQSPTGRWIKHSFSAEGRSEIPGLPPVVYGNGVDNPLIPVLPEWTHV